MRDYSGGHGDPYGIRSGYTVQSADQYCKRVPWSTSSGVVDVRGNSLIVPRDLPTQEEADRIKGYL